MKKVFGLFLATTLVVSTLLTGCSKSAEGGAESAAPAETTEAPDAAETEGGEATENVESADKIVIFQSKVEISDQLEACAAAYQEIGRAHV